MKTKEMGYLTLADQVSVRVTSSTGHLHWHLSHGGQVSLSPVTLLLIAIANNPPSQGVKGPVSQELLLRRYSLIVWQFPGFLEAANAWHLPCTGGFP